MDFFSEETFMKIEDEPTSSTSDFMKIEDEFTSSTSASMNKEDEPISSTSAFMNIEDESTPSTSANMRIEDEPTPSRSTFLGIEDESTSITPAFMNIEDEFTTNTSVFKNKEDESISSTSTIMRIEEELSSSTSTNMRTEDESTSSTSTISFNVVQQDRKRKQRRKELSFKPYILKVKKTKIPNLQLSTDALDYLNNIISDIYQLYDSELKQLISHTKKKTLSIKEIENATKLCIPGKRKNKAMNYGRDCVSSQELDLKQKPLQ
ncbi:hypothetical protein AVEN_145643-1 [Araneus ventricosus]|uniref:Histone H2A/H2B/H3 domain-containing protein n=1 Tax=Araneus ventricosus TaxID=182803 RepID=A0A4Y2JP96_ARAVE|nr:hypothetical protein AVEN_145643-1 [Araneus ventricosus]